MKIGNENNESYKAPGIDIESASIYKARRKNGLLCN